MFFVESYLGFDGPLNDEPANTRFPGLHLALAYIELFFGQAQHFFLSQGSGAGHRLADRASCGWRSNTQAGGSLVDVQGIVNIQYLHGARHRGIRSTQRKDRASRFDSAPIHRALMISDVPAKKTTPQARFVNLGIRESVAIQHADIPGREAGGLKRASSLPGFSRLIVYGDNFLVSHHFSFLNVCSCSSAAGSPA